MNTKHMIILSLILLFCVGGISAQEITPSPTPKFREEIKKVRGEIQQLRKDVKQEVKDTVQDLKETNKQERMEFRDDRKATMERLTIEERRKLRPTLIQQSKELMKKNQQERQVVKKTVRDQLTATREQIQAKWNAFWGSIFGKK